MPPLILPYMESLTFLRISSTSGPAPSPKKWAGSERAMNGYSFRALKLGVSRVSNVRKNIQGDCGIFCNTITP